MAIAKKTKASQAKGQKVVTAGSVASASAQAMRLEVMQIQAYERNPRRSPNPEYDRIKASIRACGMDQPLRITRRPGESEYFVQAGGNTRLKAQQELYETTGKERFRWVDCLYIEWQRESAVLLAHLRENELRGNLSFIDRARAVMEIQRLAAIELGVQVLSDRELEGFLKDQGYFASRSLISVMDYAGTVLLPLLPRALGAGLGRPQVQRIRDLERVGRTVWQLQGGGEDSEFDSIFEALCRRHDHEDWVFDTLRQAVETEIAEAAELPIQRIRMEFDCRLEGREPDIPDFVIEEAANEQPFPMSSRDEPEIVSTAERQALLPRAEEAGASRMTGESGAKAQATSADAIDPAPTADEIAIELPAGPDLNAVLRRVAVATKGPMPLALLRETAHELARGLALGHGLGSLIEALPDDGLGYVVSDVPPVQVIEQLDTNLRTEVLTVWWQLITFADLADAPPVALEDCLAKDGELAAAVKAQDFSSLLDRLAPAKTLSLGRHFWARLSAESWCLWLCLAHNYRELHRSSRVLQQPLWRSS